MPQGKGTYGSKVGRPKKVKAKGAPTAKAFRKSKKTSLLSKSR